MKKLLILSVLLLASCAGAPAESEAEGTATFLDLVVTVSALPTATNTPTNTPIPTVTPTPTATPWIFPTPIWDPVNSWPFGLPGMVAPIEPAWTDDVEVYVLLGSDYASWRRNLVTGTDNTDAFVILIVNKQTERISMISVPRDLYVFLPGFGMQRINTAWRLGGQQMVADALRYNFGLPMHGYAYVRMSAFSRFIDDALHGIDVEVKSSVYDHCGDMEIDLLPGTHFMDGPKALCYVRVRMYDSAFARQNRQREVLRAMKGKFLEIATDKPATIAGEILDLYQSEHRYTDVGLFDVLRLLPLALDAEIVEYQMDYNIDMVHFTHPQSGAWLISPPDPQCMYTLMWHATMGEPWEILPDGVCSPDK